jgi:type IV pilus biogenesis protein CpaD/CtpE
MRARRRFPTCRLALGLAAAAALLGGCAAQPVGSFGGARITSEAAQVQRDLLFRPGTAQLLPGEAERLNGLLRSLPLRAEDDVVLTFGSTGSEALDARRAVELRRVVAHGPARLRIRGPVGLARAPERPDVVLAQVLRYDSLRVACEGGLRADGDRPLPAGGCANAVNVASMAAEKRDLVAPRELRGSEVMTSVGAIERHRAGDVKFTPLDSSGN